MRNVLVYLGSLGVEHARILPMYARLCAAFDVDCFDPELLHSSTMFLCGPGVPGARVCVKPNKWVLSCV